VLAIGDERVFVRDTGRLCKVDHFVHLSRECVDAGDTGQVDTWVAGEDVATTCELCVEYNLVSGVKG
jgi:hypothetical protein